MLKKHQISQIHKIFFSKFSNHNQRLKKCLKIEKKKHESTAAFPPPPIRPRIQSAIPIPTLNQSHQIKNKINPWIILKQIKQNRKWTRKKKEVEGNQRHRAADATTNESSINNNINSNNKEMKSIE